MTRGLSLRIVLALLLALGLGARLYHLDYGLPHAVEVDAFKSVDEAARMAAADSLRPQEFQHPGLYPNLLAVTYKVFGIDSPYYQQLCARIVSALAGTALIFAVWWLGTAPLHRHPAVPLAHGARTKSSPMGEVAAEGRRSGALLASALVAFSPLSLTLSRSVGPDMLLALFATLSLAACVRERWILAGLSAGLAAGAKFTGLFLIVPLLVKSRRSLLIAPFVFLLTTPYFLSHWDSYSAAMSLEAAKQSAGALGHVQLGWLDYLFSSTPVWEMPWLQTSLLGDLGLLTLAAGLAGIYLAFRAGIAPAICAGYVVLYLALVSHPGHVKAARYLIPILPAFCALAGFAAEYAVAKASARRRGWAFSLAAAALLAAPLERSARYLAMFGAPSSNELASAWLTQNVPHGSRIFAAPFHIQDMTTTLPFEFLFSPDAGNLLHDLPLPGMSPERTPLYGPAQFDRFRRDGVRYVMLNSWADGALSPDADNLRHFPVSTREFQGFIGRLGQEAELVYMVEGWNAGRYGPDIVVYRLREG